MSFFSNSIPSALIFFFLKMFAGTLMLHFSFKIKTYKALTDVWLLTMDKFARMQQLPVCAPNWGGGSTKYSHHTEK
jgi:hypothetical protein